MRATATLAISAAALAVGIGVGFGLGRATASPGPDVSSVDAFRRALDEQDWLKRTQLLSAFLQELSPENLPGSLDVLEARLPWVATEELRLFMLAWTRFDPGGALERALSWPGEFRRNGSGAAMYAWGYNNPSAALWALDSLEDPQLRPAIQRRLVAGWTHSEHKQSANDYIASLPGSQLRFAFIGMLVWEISKQGTEALMRWVEEVPDDPADYKLGVFMKATSTLVALDAPATASWVATHLQRDYAEDSARVVARVWAAEDPTATLTWLAGLPEDKKLATVLSNSFTVWLDRAPDEATAWLRSATPASSLDPAVRVLVNRSLAASPEIALEWAKALDDVTVRTFVLTRLGRTWLQRDAEGAATWLKESDLPSDVMTAIFDPGSQSAPAGRRIVRETAADARSTEGEAP